MSVQFQVKVIVVEKILRNAGHGRSQSVGDGEQSNAYHRRLVQPPDPAEQDFDATLPAKKKQVNNQNHPGKASAATIVVSNPVVRAPTESSPRRSKGNVKGKM
jgi:hypothetical protein